MGLIDKIGRAIGVKELRLRNRQDLAAFMDSRAAFLAQKCVVEFCRVRAGVYWQKLFSEEEFQRELTRSRWRSYPATYAMMAEMVEGALRVPAGTRRIALADALSAVAAQTFDRYSVPEGEVDAFWGEALRLVEDTLQKARGDAARPVREIPKPLARTVFDALPLHKDVVTNDYDYIFNNLRMNLLRAHEEFVQAAVYEPLLADLLPDQN